MGDSQQTQKGMSDKFKDWITDIIGLIVLIVATSKMIFGGWDNTTLVIAYVMGLGIFLLPDGQIKTLVVESIKALINKWKN